MSENVNARENTDRAALSPDAVGGAGDESAREIVFRSDDFFRSGYKKLLSVAVLEAIIIIGLCGALFFVIKTHQPIDRYYAVTGAGKLYGMSPLAQPNLTDGAVLDWSAQVAADAMTFGFNDYRRRFQEVSRNFTHAGWLGYTRALRSSGAIGILVSNQHRVTAAPAAPPVLSAKFMSKGRFMWRVQMWMVLTTEAGSELQPGQAFVEMVIVRVPQKDNPRGIGVESIYIQ